MTVEQHNIIDFVVHNTNDGVVILIMVEAREWGDFGHLLPDLQEKFNTYLSYVTDGQLVADYPQFAGIPVRIELRTSHAPGERELEFLRIAAKLYLEPAGIALAWKGIGDATALTIIRGSG